MKNRHLLPLFVLALTGCGKTPASSESPGKLSVAVAASMRYAYEEISADFVKSRPGVTIEPTYGASGVFYAQITQRAPFDFFLSADTTYPDKLKKEGHADGVFPYATGRLVLWSPKSAGLEVAQRGMEALKDPRISRISIANPELAPYGRAAESAMRHYGVETEIAAKLVRAENVGQSVQFVQSGAAQIGLIAYSLTFVPEMKDGDLWLVPVEAHEPLLQSGVILPQCRDRELAVAFRDFLLGPEGLAILKRHGFSAP
jgi:molybdate transport system substrate-binding protein